MLGRALVSLLFLQLSLTYGWDEDRKAPGPTDCTGNQNHTFCGVTFHCKCIWKMPTLMEAKKGCGVVVNVTQPTDDEPDHEVEVKPDDELDELVEVYPILFPPRRSNSLKLMNSVEDNREDDLWDEIGEDENEGDDMEDDEDDRPDTEGCGVGRHITRNNETFKMESLRPATIKNKRFYLPGQIKTILEIVHQTTGGKCRIKQRSRKNKPKKCKKKNLKEYENLSLKEFEEQEHIPYVFRVGLGKSGMKEAAKLTKDAVNQVYLDKYNCPEEDLPCFLAPQEKEILCTL
ncbi:uncharacterized protein LOC134823770 [Bolinopsis microptera]|uniref:uncharacterized protein LOC134823770 n=1 Tax=Bolinopsis microptera TaxID=2820187 RepID=UPI003078E415